MANSKPAEPRLRHGNRIKHCTQGWYHLGAVLLFVGLIVAILGVGSSNLFEIIVYDNRHPPLFHHIAIEMGLFTSTGEIRQHNDQQIALTYPPVFEEPRWIAAKVAAVVGLVGGLFALLLHLILALLARCRQTSVSTPWYLLLIEILGFLTAVVGLLIGLSMAECELESVHKAGDEALTIMLQRNNLLPSSAELDRNFLPNYDSATVAQTEKNPLYTTAAEFDLVLSPPQSSFYVLIAADFILLLAFLAAFIHFVRVSKDIDNLRKQLRSAKVAKPVQS